MKSGSPSSATQLDPIFWLSLQFTVAGDWVLANRIWWRWCNTPPGVAPENLPHVIPVLFLLPQWHVEATCRRRQSQKMEGARPMNYCLEMSLPPIKNIELNLMWARNRLVFIKVLFLKDTLAKATRTTSLEETQRWRVIMISNFKYLMGHHKSKDFLMLLQENSDQGVVIIRMLIVT